MSEKYHYEPGAIHNDNHKEINIGNVPEKALGDIIRHFLKDDAIDAEYKEVRDDIVEETNHSQQKEEQEEMLNYFAPKKNLKELLKEDWFLEVCVNNKYNKEWIDNFIDALMASEWREYIVSAWSIKGIRNKHTQMKGYIIGLLKDAGVLKGSYESIAREACVLENSRLFARYMGDGKKQPYADWIIDYIEKG